MATKEKLKTDEFDFDEDLNFDDLGFGDDSGFEVKDDRTPVIKVLDGAVEGAKDTLTDPGFIRKTVLESLPREYGETYAKLDEAGTGVVRLYNDAVKEVKPTVNRVIKQVDKLIPQESKRTRAFLEKIKEFVGEDYEYKQLSKEQQEEQSIQNSLGAIFQTQSEEEARQRNEDRAETLIQTQVEKDRFEHESGLLASIDNNLAKLTQYNEKINQAYQKKTLELQFRGYFLQQDMLATTKKYFEVFEKQNEAITKNTALPEFVKITKAESFKEHMREKFNTSVTAGLFGDNDFVKKGFERISNALKSKLQEFKSGLEDGVSIASEAKGAFSSEEEGGMGIDKYEFGGKMAGSQGVGYLGSKLGKYLRDKIESSDGKFAEWIKKTGFKSATAAGNVPGFLANLRNSDTLQDNWEDGGIKSALKEGTKWLLDQFTESGPDMSLAEAPGMNKLGAPAVFDNKVHRSITEIIPGFLSRILQELQITRTGNPAVPLTKFDYDGGGFTTTKKLAEKIKAKLKDDAKSTGYESKLQETTRRFMADSKFDGKTQEAVQAFLKQKSFDGGTFDPKEMLEESFLNTIPSSKRKAFKKFVEETYGQDTAKSAKNEFVFSNDMVNLRKSIADLRGSVQTYENAGYGDILRELGVVGTQYSKNQINSEAYQNLLLSDKDERKLAATQAYLQAASGEEYKAKPKSWELESDAVDAVLKPGETDKYTPGGSFKIEEVSLEPITKRLDTIIENMKESPKEGIALSDIRAKKGISKFDPRQALENIKNTKIFNWMYKKGKGDEQAHVGPMAQDVNAVMGEEAAPGGTSIDLVSLNGNNMAAIEALRQEQEVIKEKVTKTPLPKDPQKPMGLLESIKQDTSTIADLLANKGIVIGSFPSIEFNTDGVEKLAKAFSDSMADYKEKSFEFFESMQKKLSEVSGFGMSMPNMPTFQAIKDSKVAKAATSYFDKIREKGKVVGSSMWEGTKSLFNFGKEKAKDAGGFLKRQYEDKKEPAKEAIGKVFKASFDIAGNVLKGANRIVTETLPAGVRQVKDLLKTVRDKALDILDQPTDIYVLGNPTPVMLANLMKFGHYFDQATGKPIVKPSQIVGPVVDKQGNYVLTAADLATGIVDKDGNKIETPVKKLIGIGVRAVANGISVANNAVRNVLSIGKGGGEKLLDGFRGMVKKLLPTDIIGFGFDKSHKVLLDIREILNNRLPGEPMQFSDAKPVTTTPAIATTPKEVSGVVAKTPGQLSLFPEELVQEQTPVVENGEIKKPNTSASEVGAKVIQAKTKVKSLFEKVKNKATSAAKKVKRRLDLQDDGKEGMPTSFVDKLLNKAKVLKQKSVEFLKPVNETQTPNNDLQQDLFAGQTDQATQYGAPSPKTTLSVFKDKITNKLQSVKQKSEPLLKRTRDAVAGLKKPETSLTASGNLQQEALSSAANIKQNIVSFFNSLKPKDEKENLDQLSLFENDSIAKVNNPVDKLKEQVIKTKDSLVQKFKDVKDTVNAKVNEKQQYNIPQAISNTVNLVKERLKKVSNKEADSTDSVPNTKWSSKPLLDKLKSPKKTLSGFANTVSNWLGKEVEPKQTKETTDDLEVKVSEPESGNKDKDPEKKSVFERITEFTVSGKGKLAELISDKLAGSLKEKVLPKLFGNKKQTDSSTLDANEDKKEKVIQTEKPEPKYKGGNVLDSVQNLAMGGLQKFKDSKIGSFVSERNSAGKADVKEKLLGLFDKLKDSGKKAKEFVTRTPQDRQQVVPQKETPSQAPEMSTTGIMTGGKGLLGGLLGKATGAIGGVAGMLGGLLPGGGNKTESPAKDTSAESEKEKPGALGEIKDLLSGLLKRREGPELEGGKRFNDADGDGDRDGNAQEQFDRIEQIKKDRDAKTDKTVASLDPRYKSSENIIDTIINKAKGLAGMVTGAAGGGSLLGTAADVLGNLPGRGGNGGVQLPQGTVPGQSGPGIAGPGTTVPKKPGRFGSILKGGAKLGLGAGAAYGLFHLAEKAREGGNETLSDALSMGGNVAGAYGAFQGLSGLASVMAGSGGITGALGTLGTAASGAVGALGSGAATVGSSLLGGGASVLGAVAMNPLFYVPAAAGLLAYGGYKAYKAYKRVKPTPITKLRLSQYGFTEKASDHYSPVLKLEEYLNEKAIGYNQGQAYLIEKNIKPEEIFNILGVPPKDAEGRSKALQWFVTRFKPVYLNHLSTLYSVAPKARLEDIDGLDDSVKQRYLPAVQMPDGPYDQLVSPIPGMEYLPAGPDAVQKAYEEATSSTGKKKQDQSVKDVLAFKESKLGTPANKDASVLPEVKSAEEKSLVHDAVKKTATVLGIESVYEGFKKLFTKPVVPFANAVTVDDKSPLTGLESVRFKLYGAINPTAVHVSAFRSFEKAMYPLLQMDSSLTVKVNAEAVQVLENYGKLFGVAINSKEAKVWLDWYFKRFLPVFTSFVGETYKLTFNSKFETNEKKLKPSEHYEVALKLTGLGNVWVCASNPFPGEVANTNPSSVDGNMAYMKSVASQKPAPELTLGSQTKLEPAKPLPQTAGANEQKAGKPVDPTASYSKPRPAESSEPADDGNYPLPPKMQSVSALGVPASQSYSAPDSEGEEKVKGEVNKPPKAKSAGPAGESSAPVSAPSSIPNAGGPLKTGVDGSKYLKKANAGVDLNGLNPMLSKHLLGMAQEYGEKTGQSIVVNSAYRSYEKQAALHRADPDKAAKPGKSLHEFGLAMDINERIASKLESLGLMKKYGFTRPVGKEGWHVEPAGIQANLNKARQDKQFADQAIAASPGRGGGGAWDQPGVRQYGRNTRLALATFNAGSAQPVDLPETKTAQNSGSLPPPSQSTPASKDSPGGSASAAASKLSTGSSTPALGGGVKASQVNTVPGAVPGTVRSASPSGTNSADSSKPSQTLEPRSKPLPGTIPGTVAGKNSQTSAEEPEDAGTYNKPSKTRVVKGKEGVKDIIADAAKKAGVQPDYMQTIAAIESALNPQAASPTGKAVGLFQFQPKTWEYITQKTGHKYGITPATPRTDPYSSTLMAAEYAKANERVIKKYKTNPTAADFYLPHFMGSAGGLRVVKASPDQLASEVNPDAAANPGNSSMFFKDKARTQPFTVAEFYNNIVNKLKKRANEFGIKFTDKFYDQDKIKGAENSNTGGSREEAEYANAGQGKGVMRGGKSVEGSVPGTVRDSSKPVAESKQVGNQTTTGKPLQSAKAEDSYTTRDGSTITIKELPPLPDEQRTFKPTKSVLGETKPESNKESIYALNNYSLGNNKAADLPPGHFDKTAQPTTALSTAPDKKDNTYVPRNKSTVSIAEVPVTSALTPPTPVSLTGGASAANSAVIGGQLKTDTRETFPRANLASGVDTTSVILNESLSVQKQMLDVLKNILTKSNMAPAPTAAQAPTPTSTNTVNNPATFRPAGELADEPRPVDPPRGGRFNPPTEALPKPAVSLKRMIA